MPLSKEQKVKALTELKEKISRQKAIIFIDLAGLKVKEIFALRKKFKAADSELKVGKKTLMGIAFKEANLPVQTKNLSGEVAIGIGYKDEVAPAKTVWQFLQENPALNINILGGILENQFIEKEKVLQLAKIPSRQELLGKLVGSVAAPMSGLLNVFQGNIKGLIFALSAIKDKKQ